MKDIISLIGAAAENNAIGYRGLIPWHIRADFQYFKRTTMGHPVIMGLGTWRSFSERCLPGRRNMVVSDQPLTEADRVFVTRIHTVVEPADAFFPEIDPDLWKETFRSIRYHDEESGYDYTFLLYEKRK